MYLDRETDTVVWNQLHLNYAVQFKLKNYKCEIFKLKVNKNYGYFSPCKDSSNSSNKPLCGIESQDGYTVEPLQTKLE